MKRIGGRLARCTFAADELVRGSVRAFAVSARAESWPKISGDELTQIFGSAPADQGALDLQSASAGNVRVTVSR